MGLEQGVGAGVEGVKGFLRLEVPYFRQALIGSCGPACLMMVIKYIRPSMDVGRMLEFRAWMDAALAPLGMTEAFGLANFARKMGLDALVVKEGSFLRMTIPRSILHPVASRLLMGLFQARYGYLKREAVRRGVIPVDGPISLGLVSEALRLGIPPIVMVDQGRYAPDEGFPEGVLHWVVVTGYDSRVVYFNDPELGPGLRLAYGDFEKAMDLSSFGKDREVLLVGPYAYGRLSPHL